MFLRPLGASDIRHPMIPSAPLEPSVSPPFTPIPSAPVRAFPSATIVRPGSTPPPEPIKVHYLCSASSCTPSDKPTKALYIQLQRLINATADKMGWSQQTSWWSPSRVDGVIDARTVNDYMVIVSKFPALAFGPDVPYTPQTLADNAPQIVPLLAAEVGLQIPPVDGKVPSASVSPAAVTPTMQPPSAGTQVIVDPIPGTTPPSPTPPEATSPLPPSAGTQVTTITPPPSPAWYSPSGWASALRALTPMQKAMLAMGVGAMTLGVAAVSIRRRRTS